MTDAQIEKVLRDLFRSQRYAVLATDSQGQPFTSLMAFAVSGDLGQLVVLTERAARKFANLTANRRVALLIDNRENVARRIVAAGAVIGARRLGTPTRLAAQSTRVSATPGPIRARLRWFSASAMKLAADTGTLPP